MTRILLIGHGRMGVLVENLAPEYGCEIAGVVTGKAGVAGITAAPEATDVAIDFTTANAVATNIQALAERKINVVIGTTGWQAQEAAVRAIVERHGIGVLAASNFSIGLHIFKSAVAQAAAGFAAQDGVGAVSGVRGGGVGGGEASQGRGVLLGEVPDAGLSGPAICGPDGYGS